MTLHRLLAAASAFALLGACAQEETQDRHADAAAGAPASPASGEGPLYARHAIEQDDRFTYANYNEVRVTNLALDLDVDFAAKVLDGTATLDIEYVDTAARRLVLDTDDLTIKSVEAHAGGEWTSATIELGADDPALGSRLEIALPDGADQVRIAYRTSPSAQGLQWLTPEQTAGKVHPFMYSQNQAIHARSMAPVQDTPAVRMTYSATVRTPPALLAVMSAEQDEGPRDGEYSFEMPQAVPSYLLAIAVGDVGFKAISDTIGVYAEPSMLNAAAAEFADTPKMEEAAAALYGPYRWGRYDLIVLPPSFPFGGMENPRLSFITPTLIAGDKSLTNTIAHELAHSWSGNLVTNATWRDAWLNEGVTSYVENRIMEALYGHERAVMEQSLALQDLNYDIETAERPELTQLKMPADLAHPDDAFSQVAYVKGQFFMMFLEERYGRDAFDAFLKGYFDHFAFKSITTEDFVAYLAETIAKDHPRIVKDSELNEWLYRPDLPASAAKPAADAFDKVEAQQAMWLAGGIAAKNIDTGDWSAQEWLHFINALPEDMTTAQLSELDAAFKLTGSKNAEIAFAWYLRAIEADYEPALPAIDAFLQRVGRGKFIYRLYEELAKNDQKVRALDIYERARPGYHPIAQTRIDEILKTDQ